MTHKERLAELKKQEKEIRNQIKREKAKSSAAYKKSFDEKRERARLALIEYQSGTMTAIAAATKHGLSRHGANYALWKAWRRFYPTHYHDFHYALSQTSDTSWGSCMYIIRHAPPLPDQPEI